MEESGKQDAEWENIIIAPFVLPDTRKIWIRSLDSENVEIKPYIVGFWVFFSPQSVAILLMGVFILQHYNKFNVTFLSLPYLSQEMGRFQNPMWLPNLFLLSRLHGTTWANNTEQDEFYSWFLKEGDDRDFCQSKHSETSQNNKTFGKETKAAAREKREVTCPQHCLWSNRKVPRFIRQKVT